MAEGNRPQWGPAKMVRARPEKMGRIPGAVSRELAEPAREELLRKLAGESREGTITLIFAARSKEHNNAVVVKELLEDMAAETI